MPHVCPTCKQKMAWVPNWDHDIWRCKLCGTVPPVPAERSGQQRLIDLAKGFDSDEAATRDCVRTLFLTATPRILNDILEAEAHTLEAHRRELAAERRRGCIQMGIEAVGWLVHVIIAVFSIIAFRGMRTEDLFDLFTGSDPPPLETSHTAALSGLDQAARVALSAARGKAFAGTVARAVLDDRLRDVAMAKLPEMAGCFGSEAADAAGCFGGNAAEAPREEFGREDAKRLSPTELAALLDLLRPWGGGNGKSDLAEHGPAPATSESGAGSRSVGLPSPGFGLGSTESQIEAFLDEPGSSPDDASPRTIEHGPGTSAPPTTDVPGSSPADAFPRAGEPRPGTPVGPGRPAPGPFPPPAHAAPPEPPSQWDVVLAACHMLSFTEHEPAVEPLHRLTESWWGLSRSVPARVRAAARLSVEAIERRLTAIREQETLLRPARERFPDTTDLLRPATAGEEPPEQLLRPKEPE